MNEKMDRDDLMRRLGEVVGAYGANQDRWPEADRRKLASLLAGDDDARRMLQQAAAVDRLLIYGEAESTAAIAGDGADALSQRIMAQLGDGAAVASGPQPTADVISLSERRRQQAAVPEPPDEQPSAWMPVAALAASLMLGIFVGAGGYLETTTSSLTELAGLTSAPVTLETLQLDDGFGPVEEEYL